jgi:hypothetical protein
VWSDTPRAGKGDGSPCDFAFPLKSEMAITDENRQNLFCHCGLRCKQCQPAFFGKNALLEPPQIGGTAVRVEAWRRDCSRRCLTGGTCSHGVNTPAGVGGPARRRLPLRSEFS